ncbi:MAG: DUF5056 domain-containing protein [Pseudomonadota bacterium]
MTEQRDWLDEVLEQTSHIDDAGFSDQVMAKLPARRQRAGLRDLVLAVAALGGGLLAFVVTPGLRVLGGAALEVVRYHPGASIPVLSLLLLLTFATVSAILVQEN